MGDTTAKTAKTAKTRRQPARFGQLSLRTRISLLLTAVSACLTLALGALWLQDTRASIDEEITAGTRVCEQWLTVLAGELNARPDAAANKQLLARVRAAGRIRANALSAFDASGQVLYVSPGPRYKAGRAAPAWFARLIDPHVQPRRIVAGGLTLILTPDPSRASVDAWDSAQNIMLWACALLALLFLAIRRLLDRALAPLEQIRGALERTGRGRHDLRLPVYAARELNLLAHAYNGMADRLELAVSDNVRLYSECELAQLMQSRLERERRGIAQELHDELAQGITAVRALAGAIVQRTAGQAALHGHAQSIIAVTNDIQQGIRHILQQLRPSCGDTEHLNLAMQRHLSLWHRHYPQLALQVDVCGDSAHVDDTVALALLRILQEGLTNVARHAGAAQVQVALRLCRQHDGDWLELTLADDGRGLPPGAAQPRGFGLRGMRERALALRGELSITSQAGQGVRLCARLPALGVRLDETNGS
ncbi:sensor histidine kinase [Rugamonas apoptosis]|uniref:histidine kinase n=1 Tax=Rugamonas apoptosis TaxID=2758570 RepID=A0A7W2ILY9_9BURK|nr:ATP-binding protein [Rugamonas apoptosis]MBA5689044.1 HAMP domain-containing protein [Rugamonas apoptosis]